MLSVLFKNDVNGRYLWADWGVLQRQLHRCKRSRFFLFPTATTICCCCCCWLLCINKTRSLTCSSAGLTYGPVFLLVTPMLISQVGMDNLPVAFGTLMLCCGVGYIIAPPIGGRGLRERRGGQNISPKTSCWRTHNMRWHKTRAC